MTDSKKPQKPDADAPVSLWQTLASVAASFFGVQSSKNRKRDFSKGRPVHFIAVALALTGAFIAILWLIVKLVMKNAGL
jgi:uncharacterized membrane protein YhdT